jgi:hypothetical protein
MKRLFLPIIGNGMGLGRLKWAQSLFLAGATGCFNGMEIVCNHYEWPYPYIVNTVADDFIKADCDELFLMDTDIVFTPQDCAPLFSHDLPYVGGIVPKRVLGLELAMFNYEPRATNDAEILAKPLIDAVFGRGFCRIKREVFDAVRPYCAEYEDAQHEPPKRMVEYFKPKPGGHSEDFGLCELARSIGIPTRIDQRIVVRHVGDITYPVPGTF